MREELHAGGKDSGCIGECLSESPSHDTDKQLCRILAGEISEFLDIGWADRSIFEKMIFSKLKDSLTNGRDSLIEQYLHTQLDLIADSFNYAFSLKEMTEEELAKMPNDYTDTIKDKGIGVNYGHASHAKLNSIVEAIKIKTGTKD